MKANEFVKKFGFEKAKQVVDGYKDAYHPSFDQWSIRHGDYYLVEKDFTVAIADLKRLVESHELVEKHGGLEKAKLKVTKLLGLGLITQAEQLHGCIADVESCQ